MFETAIAGSLPKPSWLAEQNKLWPQWKLSGDALAEAKRDATLLWIKSQEDAGIDTVGDGKACVPDRAPAKSWNASIERDTGYAITADQVARSATSGISNDSPVSTGDCAG